MLNLVNAVDNTDQEICIEERMPLMYFAKNLNEIRDAIKKECKRIKKLK